MKHTLLIITALLFITSSVIPQSKVNIKNLVEYGGKMFKQDDDKPYTGRVFDLYKSTGEKKLDGKYRKGLMNGKWTYYHENGQISEQGSFVDGDGGSLFSIPDSLNIPPLNGRSGKWMVWYENGQMEYERTYKDGKVNLMNYWDTNGQLLVNSGNGKIITKNFLGDVWLGGRLDTEDIYKEGLQIQYIQYWYDLDDKIIKKNTFKGESLHGEQIYYNDNGQIDVIENYEDGIKISNKEIDYYKNGQKRSESTYKDGELIESSWWDEDGNVP